MAYGLAELIAGWNCKKNGYVFRWNRARRILEQFFEGSERARRECIHPFKCTRKRSASNSELKYAPFNFFIDWNCAYQKSGMNGLKKQKSIVKQNKKLPNKCCLFFKQASSSYKNSILRNTFNNLSTSAVDNLQ